MNDTTPVAKTIKPHIHTRWSIKDGSEIVAEDKATALKKDFSIENILDGFKKLHAFTEYQQHYAFYKEGDTEYIRFEGTLLEDHLKLTIDVFSCYCVPLNEDQPPPF